MDTAPDEATQLAARLAVVRLRLQALQGEADAAGGSFSRDPTVSAALAEAGARVDAAQAAWEERNSAAVAAECPEPEEDPREPSSAQQRGRRAVGDAFGGAGLADVLSGPRRAARGARHVGVGTRDDDDHDEGFRPRRAAARDDGLGGAGLGDVLAPPRAVPRSLGGGAAYAEPQPTDTRATSRRVTAAEAHAAAFGGGSLGDIMQPGGLARRRHAGAAAAHEYERAEPATAAERGRNIHQAAAQDADVYFAGSLADAFPSADGPRSRSGLTSRHEVAPPPPDAKRVLGRLEKLFYSPELVEKKKVKGEHSECAVCLEHFKQRGLCCRFRCGHLFHERCVVEWFEHGDLRCPLCRYNPWTRGWDKEADRRRIQ